MICCYRYCNKEIKYGRPDRKFCNKTCRSKENSIAREIKSLNSKYAKSKEFIKRAKLKHGDKYDYQLVTYENIRTKVEIICPVHGSFLQTPDSHLHSGCGCPECANSSRRIVSLTPDRIANLKGIHRGYYEYNNPCIEGGFIDIFCPTHGTFSQYLYWHQYGMGCAQCHSSQLGKKTIESYLLSAHIEFSPNHSFSDCKAQKRLKFDFYLPKFATAIEYRGKNHFIENKYYGKSGIEYTLTNDDIKEKYCIGKGIKLIRIPYWDLEGIDEILSKILK